MDPALKDRRLEGLEGEELIERGRDLAAQPLAGRERAARWWLPPAFCVCAVAMALLLDADRSFSVPLACMLVGRPRARGADQVRGRGRLHRPDAAGARADAVPAADAASSRCWSRSATCSATCPTTCAGSAIRSARSSPSPIRGIRLLRRSCSSPSTRRRRSIEDWPVYLAALVAQSSLDFCVTSLPRVVRAGAQAVDRAARLGMGQRGGRAAGADRAARDVLLARRRVRAAAGPAGRSGCSTSSPTSASAGSTARSSCATHTSARRSCSAT